MQLLRKSTGNVDVLRIHLIAYNKMFSNKNIANQQAEFNKSTQT